MRVEVILRMSEKGGLASAEEKNRRGELIEPTIQRIGEKIKMRGHIFCRFSKLSRMKYCVKLSCKIYSSQSGGAGCGVNSSSRDYILSSAG